MVGVYIQMIIMTTMNLQIKVGYSTVS